MKKHKYNNFIIEISNDSQYTFNSTDNKNVYEKILFGEDKDGYFTSTHGIKIFADGNQISSCLVANSGGATGIHETCSLIDDGKVLICCGDSVFCLTLPDLELKWKTKLDWATCFQIFEVEETYLVHGELTISRIGKDGKILWQFEARDIFVSGDGTDIFEIHSDHILVSDWTETVYKLDFDGKLLDEFSL